MEQKVIFLDLDGTLTPQSTWEELNLLLGITGEEDHALFLQYLEGKFEYKAWIAELVRLYRERKIVSREEITALAGTIELRPDTLSTIAALKEKGCHLVLISGSVDTIVETISKKVGTDAWLACSQAVFNEAGILTDIVSGGDEGSAKLKLAQEYARASDLDIAKAYVVGDGGNEKDLFEISKGILLGSNEKLQPLAWKVVGSLSEIPALI